MSKCQYDHLVDNNAWTTAKTSNAMVANDNPNGPNSPIGVDFFDILLGRENI